ncbi:hypothetical protein C0992_001378 [Termitomyces sp. T32_za158]|nr:hypothetical protein C0992_001378 [Termitomyces sp. T32_za158]
MLPPDHCPVPSFDDILDSSSLPPPGPDFYAARRALWLTPRPVMRHPDSTSPSVSRQRLEGLLSTPDAAKDDYAWNHGVKKVWGVLDTGSRLRRPLPLSLIVCPPLPASVPAFTM